MIEEGREPPADHQQGNDNRILPQLFYSSRDTEGRLVANDVVWKLRNTAKMQNLKSSERAILLFEARLRQLAKSRNIPDSVVKRATDMYHRVREKRVFNKPNLTELALGLLLTACREMKYLITYKDLCGDTASMNKIKVYHRKISISLGLAGPGSEALENRLGDLSINQYVVYYAAKVGVQQRGPILAEAFNMAKISQGAAHCVAAAALYIAVRNSGMKMSQKEYCSKVNLSEISLRDWVEKLGGYDDSKFEPTRIDPAELDDGP